MSYFLFGPNAESWAIGNPRWNAFQNLPITFSMFFENQTLTANTFKWFSTGPDGLCCFLKSDNTFLQSQNQNLVADTSPSNLYGISIQQVDHLSFSPEGGWFVRYNDGTVRLSMVGGFHQNFHSIAGEYMQTRGSTSYSRQHSQLQWVFFGADGAMIFVLDNGDLEWIGITEELQTCIRTQVRLGWCIAKESTLCHWDKAYYYLRWTRNCGLETRSSWNIKLSGIITPLLLREVAEGIIPVSHTIQASKVTPTPARDESNAWAIWPRETKCKEQITFKKWEVITNVRRITDEWYTGKNERGESGKFPRQNVTIWAKHGASNINCDDCGHKINGAFYHCSICCNDDFDLCRTCGEKPTWGTKQCYDRKHAVSLKVQLVNKTGHRVTITCKDKDWKQSVDFGVFEWLDHMLLGYYQSLPNLSSLNISSPSQPSLTPEPSSSKPEREDNDYDKELSSSLDGALVTESPDVHWDDIAGLDQAKEELNEAVILPIRFPQLFTGKRKARKGILLFGPPGTGKSYLAKACATEIKCTFFSISCSDIMSKWIGESERLVKTLFKKARKHKPSIIFIDEIDAMGGTRDEGGLGEKCMSGMKTEFLVQMDGVGNNANGVLVLAATNLPWKLDPALRRRFQRRIHIGLPDTKARTRMFEIGVGDTPCTLEPKDYEKLGEMTKGFSGSDISGVTQDALMVLVKKITSAKHFRKVFRNDVEMLTPCASSDLGAMRMRLSQVPSEKLLEPPLTSEDFFRVVAKSRPSVASDELSKYMKWTADFGSEGA